MRRRTFLASVALAPLSAACAPTGRTGEEPPDLPDGSTAEPDAHVGDDAGVVSPHAAPPVLGPYLCDPRPDAMGFFLEGASTAEYSVVVTPTHEGPALAPVAFTLDSHRIGRADVTGLSPGTQYVYDLFSADELVGGGAFVTPPATRASTVRIALGSDIHWEWKPYLAFDRIRELAPDALFMMGDQIYSDYRAPAGTVPPVEAAYRDLYGIYWDDPSLARCWANVPTLLMWDDHDILNDYDGADPTRFAAAESAYRAYQGTRNPPPYREGALYYTASIGPVDVFVLDTRSYRDRNDDPDGPDKTMLGAQQRADLEAFLLASDAPVKLVISPTPFHAHVTTNTDAWAYGFASERDALFAFLRDEGITGVVLASGDQHFPAVVRHDLGSGYSVIELQCTPTAAHPRSVPNVGDDPSVLYLGPGDEGFGLLDVDAAASPPTVRFAWVQADGREVFTLAIPSS